MKKIIMLLLLIALTASDMQMAYAENNRERECTETALDEMEPMDTSKVVDLDEVVIVAQPKEQVRLRLQPLSSSVFGDAQMNQMNVRDLAQLSQFVPSFSMPAYGARLTSSLYIRGIGSRIDNPAVGIYYDNVPLLSKAAFNHHFYMLDRVDVMRGPQGTLYGQNTEGGLVRIYSKNPMNYQGTDIRLGIGTGCYRNVEVAHHHRPSAQLAFTVAGFYSGIDGFIDNQNFDEKNDKSNEAGGKVRLMWQPRESLTFDWTADYQYVNQNGFGYGQFQPIDYSGWDGMVIPPIQEHPDDPATTIMNGYKRHLLNTALTIGYTTEQLMLTSTTSYQYLKDLMLMDQDYMTPDYLQLTQRQKQQALSEEIVVRSKGLSRWQHTSGFFAAYQWLRTDAPVGFGQALTEPIGNTITQAMKTAMQQAMYGKMLQKFLEQGMPQTAAEVAAQSAAASAVEAAGITMRVEMGVPEYFRTPIGNLGVFHETNVMLSDRLRLTLGVRFNYDRMKIDYHSMAYMNMTGTVAQVTDTYHLTSLVEDQRSKSYAQLLPKVALTYSLPNNTGNLYATIAKGYRMGGYNIQMFSDILETELMNNRQQAMQGDYNVTHTTADYDAIEDAISYKPEVSWNFEVGSHLNLFDSRVHADVALYYMTIRNQQLSQMSPLYNYGRIMTNAGKSHSLGVETTLRGSALAGRLDWSLNYGFTKASFDEYVDELWGDPLSSSGITVTNYEGNSVPFVPQHTLSALADWHINRLTLGINLAAQGKTWWNEANTYAQRFYALLGAHADYDFGAVVVSLWGRNLTDTRYNTFAVESKAAGAVSYFAQRGTPLHIGIDARIHF